jgi:cytochrome c biogenesis protein CcdA
MKKDTKFRISGTTPCSFAALDVYLFYSSATRQRKIFFKISPSGKYSFVKRIFDDALWF